MIEIARAEHPEIPFELGDVSIWESKEKYDLIIAWDSIFHLPMVKQKPVIRIAASESTLHFGQLSE